MSARAIEVLDVLATERHYVDHVAPVWWAMPADRRGTFVTTKTLEAHARRQGIDPFVVRHYTVPPGDAAVLVAGIRDVRIAEDAGRRPILLEHGAGQNYGNDHGSYSGGVDRQAVELFLTPNDVVAERNRRSYPGARHVVVGCPRLDRWAHLEPRRQHPAIAFHWDCSVAPEAGSAFRWYHRELRRTREHFGTLIGHAHPRAWPTVSLPYRKAGLLQLTEIDEVLELASVYVVDNSSTGWEAMAVGIPVVWLNAPHWRRDVELGLRFWEYADAGVQVDEASQLIGAIEEALEDSPALQERRAEVVGEIYGELDGKASLRAADAICDYLD